jgi:hypothetical protein
VEKEKSFSTDDAIRVRLNKLQLEIVPYASRGFDFSNFSKEYLEARMKVLQSVIASATRRCVFIVGSSDLSEALCGQVEWKFRQISGMARRVAFGVKLSSGIKYCFLKSYKAHGFAGHKMQEYGRLCREEVDSL